jgi:hypothetical protein
VRLSIAGVVAVSFFFLAGCSAREDDSGASSTPTSESIFTSLDAAACRREIDRSDPNETPYLVCPGAAGYALIVRRVESGRQSIDVVDAAQRVFPLNYHEFVTRHMSSLDARAEWRVTTTGGVQVPIALLVRVHAREDTDDPEKVTHSWVAVAKLTANEVCVTDRIADGSLSDADLRAAADSARQRPCVPAQPPLPVPGSAAR